VLRTPLNLNYQKRTIRPLYANTQATPKAMFLDPAWNFAVDIFPGMVMDRVTAVAGNVVTLHASATAGAVVGLADFFEAPTFGIRQITDSGINACAVWVLGPDAEFVVLSPAFDTALTYTRGQLLYGTATGAKQGALTNVSTTNGDPVAKVLDITVGTLPAQSVLTIGGLKGTL
jgi:hypothetical protein